jgi:predicted secreted protein
MEIFKKADNGREITVRRGEVIRIELEQAGATGYVWEPHDLDTERFEVLGVETRAVVRPEMTGLPVVKIWSIKALKEGKSDLRFFYYRPWEGIKNALDEFVLKVRILQ